MITKILQGTSFLASVKVLLPLSNWKLTFVLGGIVGSESHDTAAFKPEHILVTSTGRIYQTLHVNDGDVSLALTSLQHNMSKKLLGPGETNHSKWVPLISCIVCALLKS